MTIVLFRSDDQVTIRDSSSAVQTEPVFFVGEQAQGVTLSLELIWEGFVVGPFTDVPLSDGASVEVDGETDEYYRTPARGTTQTSMLMHRHFSHFQCKYTTVQPGTEDNYGEAFGNRIAGRLPDMPDDRGFKTRDSSISPNASCITATKEDQSQVVIIDPLSSVVTIMDHRGIKLDKYSMPKGEFANVIAIDADNDYYWVMRWESAAFHGGNKFNFNAYRWEDSSLVEWEWESSVGATAELAEDRMVSTDQSELYVSHFVRTQVELDADFFINSYVTFLDDRNIRTDAELEELVTYVDASTELEWIEHIVSTDVLVTTARAVQCEVEVTDYHEVDIAGEYTFTTNMDVFLEGDSTLIDISQEVWVNVQEGIDLAPDMRDYHAVSLDSPGDLLIGNAIDIGLTDDDFIEWLPHVFTEVDLSEIRIEMRFSRLRYSSSFVPTHPEPNYARQMFNLEFDVWPLVYGFNPIRTNEMKHEYPFMEERRHYYGHWSDYEFAKEHDLELVDAWFLPEVISIPRGRHYNSTGDENTGAPYPKEYGEDCHVSGPMNANHITAPNFAVTETKMVFGVTRHRGMYPYRDDRYSSTDQKYRSSQTLLMQLDKGKKWPSTKPVNVNMSGTSSFQANDHLGVVMVDSFWEMGDDDWLKGFATGFSTIPTVPSLRKLPDIVRYNFDFQQVAIRVKMFEQYFGDSVTNPDDQVLGENRPNERNADLLRLYSNRITIGHDLLDKNSLELVFNGGVKLNGTNILFRDDLIFSGEIDMAGEYSPYYFTQEYKDYYSIDPNGKKPDNFFGYGTVDTVEQTIVTLQELNDNLETENTWFTNDPLVNILSYYKEDVVWAVSSDADVHPQTSYTYLPIGPDELLRWSLDRHQSIGSDGFLSKFTSRELQYLNSNSLSLDAPLDFLGAVNLDVDISDLGYKDVTVVISNSSPNEWYFDPAYYKGRAYGAPGYCGNTIPSGIHGLYPYSARFWSPGGIGYGYTEHTAQPAWKITSLRPVHNRGEDGFEAGGTNWTDPFWSALYSAHPYPVQYVTDNVNDYIFGMHRVTEGPGFSDFTDIELAYVSDKSIKDDYDSYEEYLADGNNELGSIRLGPGVSSYHNRTNSNGCGAWLHKYDVFNQEPIDSVYIPGYFFKDTEAEYDPFVQIRYFGHSPTNKRLYVVRAYGRRDYYHSIPLKYVGYTHPYVTDIDADIPVYVDDTRFYGPYVVPESWNDYFYNNDRITLYIEGATIDTTPSGYDYRSYLTDDSGIREVLDYTTFDGYYYKVGDTDTHTAMGNLGGLIGWAPSETNAANLTPYRSDGASNYFPEGSETRWTFTSEHLTGPADLPFAYSVIDPTKVPLHEQAANIYDNRDLLVYDYDFNLLSTVNSLAGLADDDVILHVTERDNIFYVLTQVKDTEGYNWGQLAATHGFAPQAVPMSVQDDKYGYCYDRTRVYKIPHTLQGTAELIYEFDWAGHSVGDTLIQEVTDDHVWLNWSGVHKERAGTFMGVGVRLDGSGYDEVPGLVAIMYDYYEPEMWHLVCYTNISQRNNQDEKPTAEKFARWGDGERTKLSIYRERNVEFLKNEMVWQPITEWFENMPGFDQQYDVYGNNIYTPGGQERQRTGGTQPGYSQVYRKRYYDWVYSDVSLRATGSSLKPQTWIATTTGGPNTVSL